MRFGLLVLAQLGLVVTSLLDADATSLSQKLILSRAEERAKPQEKDKAPPKKAAKDLPPGTVVPDKVKLTKVRPQIRNTIDHLLARAVDKAKIPIPPPMRWDLTGKATNWAMSSYSKPRSQADLDLTSSLIDLVSSVLGGDISKLTDEQIAQQLMNHDKIEAMARHYAEQQHAPPSVLKLLDNVLAHIKSQSKMDPDSAVQMITDIAREVGGEPLASLITYFRSVASHQAEFDQAKVLDMSVPVLTQMGAPPAIAEFVTGSANNVRSKAAVDPMKEAARSLRAAAKASEQLSMPAGFAELASFEADLAESNQLTSPPEANIPRFLEISSRIADQLTMPHSVSELLTYYAEVVKAKGTPDMTKVNALIGQACSELGFPPAVSSLLNYTSTEGFAQKLAHDTAVQKQFLLQLSQFMDQLQLPSAFSQTLRDAQAAAESNQLTPKKAFQLNMQLLRKAGAPNIADVMSHLQGAILEGKQPDMLGMMAAMPALMKLPDDVEKLQGVMDTASTKLWEPVMPAYERVTGKLMGGMPESALKSMMRFAVNSLRPGGLAVQGA